MLDSTHWAAYLTVYHMSADVNAIRSPN